MNKASVVLSFSRFFSASCPLACLRCLSLTDHPVTLLTGPETLILPSVECSGCKEERVRAQGCYLRTRCWKFGPITEECPGPGPAPKPVPLLPTMVPFGDEGFLS